jgi:hypothetical protein
MVADDRNSGTRQETPEEVARAIASALKFLRDEALAAGMYDVHVVIELARAAASGHCRQPARAGHRP